MKTVHLFMPLSFLEWNDLLARRYFNEEMAGKEVIIFANRELIDSIGSEFDEGFESFCQTLKNGPPSVFENGICQKALAIAKNWRQKKFLYPPYFAYLVLFVTAATIKSEFDLKAYYPLLRRILGEPEDAGPFPSYDKMDQLWEDLQNWSVIEMHESLGRYTFRIHGGKKHVGIPFSQAVFSENDRKLLHLFFWEHGFDPVDPPSEITILKKLVKWGRKRFTPRTMTLLESKEESFIGFQSAIADLVVSDLREWDQTDVPEWDSPSKTPNESRKPIAFAGARICLKLELFGGMVQPYMRIRTGRPFPDGGLEFNFNGISLRCREMGSEGWSTILESVNGETKKTFNAASLDWKKDYSFIDHDDSWISRLKGSLIKVFLHGITEELPDWIEVQRVIPNSKYLICCHKSVSAELLLWGRQSNDSFKELLLIGLPPDWLLFEAEGIQSSFPGSDALTLSQTSTFTLQGGIRIGRGNQYLSIVPPSILVESGPDSGSLLLNGIPITQPEFQNKYLISGNLPRDTPLIIELQKKDGTTIRKRTIYLVLPEFPVQPQKIISRDKFGDLIEHSKDIHSETIPMVSGVYLSNMNLIQREISFIPTYSYHRIIFIGKVAGQIVEWPDEDLPTEWQPVWSIFKKRRDIWQVHFCNLTNTNDLKCSKDDSRISTRDVKRWRNAIYRRRDRILPPQFREKQILWNEYVRFARNV